MKARSAVMWENTSPLVFVFIRRRQDIFICTPVTCAAICPLFYRVVSGSRDATLRVWDIETGQCLHVLMGHVAAVRCVQYDGRRVVSGAYDFMVKVWDPETETCLHTLQGHTNRVYSLQVWTIYLHENFFVFFSFVCIVSSSSLFDLQSNKKLHFIHLSTLGF